MDVGLPQNLGNPLLFHAVNHCNQQDIIQLIQSREAEVNARNVNNSTPLHYAVDNQNEEIVLLLLKLGGDPNIQEIHDIGLNSVLHKAVQKSKANPSIIKLLLDYGSNINQQSKSGFTPLHYACKLGNIQTVQILMDYGADPNIRDQNGYSPSYWAKLGKYDDICDILPQPMFITPKELYDYRMAMREIHGFEVKLPKKKGKKKKGKKKK